MRENVLVSLQNCNGGYDKVSCDSRLPMSVWERRGVVCRQKSGLFLMIRHCVCRCFDTVFVAVFQGEMTVGQPTDLPKVFKVAVTVWWPITVCDAPVNGDASAAKRSGKLIFSHSF